MRDVKPVLDLQLVCDFVNSVDLEDGPDQLADGAGLAAWLRARGLPDERPTERDAADARALREALRELMVVNSGAGGDVDAAVGVLDDASRRAGIEVRFESGAIRLVPRESGVGAVLAAAGQAMADGSWQRAKACRSETCRWAFVDHSRNGSRQWCSMSVCGNREKARTFRRRHA
jgi:predicted RNA-binding Zn ribbon-like protein